MEYILIIIGFAFILSGIIGGLIPAIPGPPLSVVGLWCLFFSDTFHLPQTLCWILSIIGIGVFLLDYWFPSMGTKIFKGSRYATTGTTIGLIFGLFIFPPWGLLIFPFIGAFIGELIFAKNTKRESFKIAFGSLMGFLLGTGLKVIYGIFILVFPFFHL